MMYSFNVSQVENKLSWPNLLSICLHLMKDRQHAGKYAVHHNYVNTNKNLLLTKNLNKWLDKGIQKRKLSLGGRGVGSITSPCFEPRWCGVLQHFTPIQRLFVL